MQFPGALAGGGPLYPGVVAVAPIPVPEFTEPYFDHDQSDFGLSLIGAEGFWEFDVNAQDRGPATRNGLAPPTRQHAGRVQHSFVKDFYNRIHISPRPLDFGSVLEESTRELEVWNAFFEDSTYTDQIIVNLPGIEFDPDTLTPPDRVIKGLDNYTIKVTATTDGPAVIDGLLDLIFVATSFQKPSPSVQILGRRGKLFPFFTSWENDPIERMEWRTNILETDDWDERRFRLRQWPRMAYQLGIGAVGLGAANLRVALMSAQNEDYGLPLWMYEGKITDEVQISDETIMVPTEDSCFKAGGSAILIESEARFETVEILEVQADRLILPVSQGATQQWPRNTLIYPVRVCRIDNVISISASSGNSVKAVVNLQSKEKETVFDSQSFPSYVSRPVIDYVPNWRSGRKSAYQRKIDIVDTGIYPKQYFNLSPRYGETQEFEWFLNGRTMVREFKALMQYLAGRQGEVWVPSWKDDMPLFEPYVSGQITLTVEGNFAAKFLSANIAEPVHLRVRLKDGREFYSQIVSAIPDPGNGANDIITLKAGWAESFSVNWVEDLSILTCVRLSADSHDITWKTPQMAIAKTTFTYSPGQPEQVV